MLLLATIANNILQQAKGIVKRKFNILQNILLNNWDCFVIIKKTTLARSISSISFEQML